MFSEMSEADYSRVHLGTITTSPLTCCKWAFDLHEMRTGKREHFSHNLQWCDTTENYHSLQEITKPRVEKKKNNNNRAHSISASICEESTTEPWSPSLKSAHTHSCPLRDLVVVHRAPVAQMNTGSGWVSPGCCIACCLESAELASAWPRGLEMPSDQSDCAEWGDELDHCPGDSGDGVR